MYRTTAVTHSFLYSSAPLCIQPPWLCTDVAKSLQTSSEQFVYFNFLLDYEKNETSPPIST